jgi:hypothetical protein
LICPCHLELVSAIIICRHGFLGKKLAMDLEELEWKLNIRLLRIPLNIWLVGHPNFESL